MLFLKPQGQGLFKFCITVQCHERWLLSFLSSNLIYIGQKYPIELKCLDFGVVGRVRIHQIPHVIFKITSQFFFNLCITHQCHERQLFCTFLAKTLFDFYNRSPSKWNLSDFRLLTKFHQICTLRGAFCWKYIKFQLEKNRGVMS